LEQKVGIVDGIMRIKHITMTAIGIALACVLAGCRTPEQQHQVDSYGFAIDPLRLPFALGDDAATVRKALPSPAGPYQFKPEIMDPLPRWNDYRYMTMQCGKPDNPKKQCGLFLFFQADGRLVSIYAAHPLDITSTPQIDINWIAGFRLPLGGDPR